jgi:VWFA-related protein
MKLLRQLLWFAIVGVVTGAGLLITGPATTVRVDQGKIPDQQPGPPGTIRVRVRLIPVDVSVTDQHDRPVLDLKQKEFQIFENGREQEIRHFFVQKLTAATPPIQADQRSIPNPPQSPAPEIAPQTGRTFLILMGRGRHQLAFKCVDSLIGFVRTKLLPQDRVAVFAYNRATNFTTDHEQVARVLERYKERADKIESILESRQAGLAAVFGNKEIPKSLQSEIDDIFALPSKLATHQESLGHVPDKASVAKDQFAVLAEANRTDEADKISPFDKLDADMITDLPFDEFAAKSNQTMQDVQHIFACIEYLRHMEGEKHLIFFTAEGLFFPRGDTKYDNALAAAANDARVAIDTFQTAGTYLISTPPKLTVGLDGSMSMSWPQPTGIGWTMVFAIQSVRTVSSLTGGRAAIRSDIGTALGRLNEATRVEYLLGYYPKDDRWDGKYRHIEVKVNRPGVKVAFRHGYYASDTMHSYDPKESIAYTRIAAAAAYESDVLGIRFTVTTAKIKGSDGLPQVRVDLQIDPTQVEFRTVNDRHAGQLRIVLFYADASRHSLGEDWQNMDMQLREETYQQFMRSAIPFSATIPLKAPTQILKVIVYDPVGDKLGSRLVRIRQ